LAVTLLYAAPKGISSWLWETFDTQSRFVLSDQGTAWGRTAEDAVGLVRAARDLTGSRPRTFITDGNPAYNAAVKKVLRTRSPLIRPKHIVGGMAENARLERYHGTHKDRYRVMRGFKRLAGAEALTEGFRLHYDYLREHGALGGRTPAVAAGIHLPFNDGWGDLIRWATYYRTLNGAS